MGGHSFVNVHNIDDLFFFSEIVTRDRWVVKNRGNSVYAVIWFWF